MQNAFASASSRFYNPERRHSALAWRSPIDYEKARRAFAATV